MPIPSLPSLHPDLQWLINMEPTVENLEDYYLGACPPWVPAGTHADFLTISNVFACSYGAPFEQALYDIFVDALYAGYRSPRREFYTDEERIKLTIALLDQRYPQKSHAERREMAEKSLIERKDTSIAVTIACSLILVNYWKETLQQYNSPPKPLDLSLIRNPEEEWSLYYDKMDPPVLVPMVLFQPHVSLPTLDVIEALASEAATESLMILTARHELGYLYRKVQQWHNVASKLDRWEHVPNGLSSKDLGLLAARARGYSSYTVGPAGGEYRQDRVDAPTRRLLPESDLAALYGHFIGWYEEVYPLVTRARTCKLEGCTALLPPYSGSGRPQEFCCAEHRRIYNELKNKSRKSSKGF